MTKDRIRGPKGDKHYETRRRSHMYYNGNFCSLNCQADWFREYGTRAIDHFGRIHEPKRVGCDSAWYKDYKWVDGRNDIHYFKNDLLGQRIAISKEQYDDQSITQPNNLSQ